MSLRNRRKSSKDPTQDLRDTLGLSLDQFEASLEIASVERGSQSAILRNQQAWRTISEQ